jgi:opine dehydrogenase
VSERQTTISITVAGAGAAGCAVAADLALAGHAVALFELPEFAGNLDPVADRGGVRLTGVGREGTARLARLTTDPAAAVDETEVILVATQAAGHEPVARSLAPHLRADHVVLLFTGYGQSLLVAPLVDALVGETVTLP